MGFIHGLHRRNLKGDLLGGLTAAVVALPLALAFGNAALGPGGAIYGLYGAIITGFLAALLGGTPAQVSGPTGPMSVTVAGVVSSLAAVGVNQDLSAGEILPMVMAAVVIGGVCEVLLGVLRLGRFITLVPYSVVSGFMSGIGFIILVLQLGPFVGIATRGGVVDSLQTLANSPGLNPAALAVGVMTLAVVFLSPLRLAAVDSLPTPGTGDCDATVVAVLQRRPVERPRAGTSGSNRKHPRGGTSAGHAQLQSAPPGAGEGRCCPRPTGSHRLTPHLARRRQHHPNQPRLQP